VTSTWLSFRRASWRKIGPWSRVAVYDVRHADGAEGRIWFKANGIGTRHEPELLSALTSIVPDLVPEVLAIDPARAWSLS